MTVLLKGKADQGASGLVKLNGNEEILTACTH